MTTTHTQVQGLITPGESEKEKTVCVSIIRGEHTLIWRSTCLAAATHCMLRLFHCGHKLEVDQHSVFCCCSNWCAIRRQMCKCVCCRLLPKKVQFPAIEQKYKLLAEKADRKDVFMIIDNARKRRQTHAQAHTVTKTPIWRQGKYLPRPEERWNEGRQWEHRQNTGKKQSEQLVQCAAAAVICRLTASRKKGTINLMLVLSLH